MDWHLGVTPAGRLALAETAADASGGEPSAATSAPSKRLREAFGQGTAHGILSLATRELAATLSPEFDYARSFGRLYLARLCQTPSDQQTGRLPPVPLPGEGELATWFLRAPPFRGLEYLSCDVLAAWWQELDAVVRQEAAASTGGPQAYLSELNPEWRFVGRVTLNLAESRRTPDTPFAFLATYTSQLNSQGKSQHTPLGRALQEYAGAKNHERLLALLSPLKQASERSPLIRGLCDTGEVYQQALWTARQAYDLLQEVPILEEAGLLVRLPDWWKARRPPRPEVRVNVETRDASRIDVLDFNIQIALDGEQLTSDELAELLQSGDGLVRLKGAWVEVDREKLEQTLEHWRKVERQVHSEGISFHEGMRLLAGAALPGDPVVEATDDVRDWTGVVAGPELTAVLSELRAPAAVDQPPSELRAELRPYQQVGVTWLKLLTRLGLGACLADDMGLGKTIQVLALLLTLKSTRRGRRVAAESQPSLLVVPASLINNWKSELNRFAPTLTYRVVHPSEDPSAGPPAAGNGSAATGNGNVTDAEEIPPGTDLVITTYGMLARLDWLRERTWQLAILDEAQAIKNAGTRQSKSAKQLQAQARIALTGTPVENRVSDLWSLFDFLNPGLLGGAKPFRDFLKRLNGQPERSYAPLRKLVQPYILRRLKTDKTVIADLPDKTEVVAYCGLSRQQAMLYEQTVRDLARKLKSSEGIQKKGLVLSHLMRFKQICNHPAQATGLGEYVADHSGKFRRLAEICGELAERQEKVLVFTQFREITDPLNGYLQEVFGRPGLVLHGGTPVGKRRQLVERFQADDGPPFFILSLKAGGTGLNLTAASHVIHFDRWWNPAVENQATDRAFRIGQKRNVLVHKFVCRGTVEERIDELIASKLGLAGELVGGGGGEVLLTELDDRQLLELVSLDLRRASEM